MKTFEQSIHHIVQSKSAHRAFTILALVCFASIFFALGVSVGTKKAEFRHRFADNYSHNFGPARRAPMGGMRIPIEGDSPNAHGAAGEVIAVSLPTYIVEGPDGIEKVVKVSDKTHIRSIKGSAAAADIQTGNNIIVIGEPNDSGQIDAVFIRIMPTEVIR